MLISASKWLGADTSSSKHDLPTFEFIF
jgi:hypothetical protein